MASFSQLTVLGTSTVSSAGPFTNRKGRLTNPLIRAGQLIQPACIKVTWFTNGSAVSNRAVTYTCMYTVDLKNENVSLRVCVWLQWVMCMCVYLWEFHPLDRHGKRMSSSFLAACKESECFTTMPTPRSTSFHTTLTDPLDTRRHYYMYCTYAGMYRQCRSDVLVHVGLCLKLGQINDYAHMGQVP